MGGVVANPGTTQGCHCSDCWVRRPLARGLCRGLCRSSSGSCHCFEPPVRRAAARLSPQGMKTLRGQIFRARACSRSASHGFALLGTSMARGSARLAVIGVVLCALVATRLADFGTEAANGLGMVAASGHGVGGQRAHCSAVGIQRNAARHHLDVVFLQAGGKALVASGGARLAGVYAGLISVLCMVHGDTPSRGPWRRSVRRVGRWTVGQWDRCFCTGPGACAFPSWALVPTEFVGRGAPPASVPDSATVQRRPHRSAPDAAALPRALASCGVSERPPTRRW